VVLFLAVPFTVLGLTLELALWHSEAEYRLEVVCDELRVRTIRAETIELRPNGFRVAVAEGSGLHLNAALFAVHADGTSDPDLAAVMGNHQLVIKPVRSPVAEEPVFAAVTVDQESGPDIKVELDPPSSEGGRGEVQLKWDRDLGPRQALKVAAAPLRQISFQGLDYTFEVRNCTVEFGTYGRDLKGNTTLRIRGQSPLRAAPVVLSFKSTGKALPEVNLNLGVRKDPNHVGIALAGNIRDLTAARILTGHLSIEDVSPMSINAGTAMEPDISVVGDASIESCDLKADGLHVRAKGKAEKVTANKEDRLPSKLAILLRSTVFLAFVAVILWLVDKLFNVYDAVKKA
jgi:hypothetical protein